MDNHMPGTPPPPDYLAKPKDDEAHFSIYLEEINRRQIHSDFVQNLKSLAWPFTVFAIVTAGFLVLS